MPKLKNSATSAIWSASSAARGISIIVPTMYGSLMPALSMIASATWRGLLFQDLQLLLVDRQRDHDLRADLDALLRARDGGLDDRRHLHVQDFGIGDAQPAAAVAEHRVGFVELLAAVPDLLRRHAGDLAELVRRPRHPWA